MSGKRRSECYGRMIPDFDGLNYNQPADGRAFRVFVERIGVGTQRRFVEVKNAWEDCIACPDYRTCYDLSMAKLALHRALAAC